MTNTQDINNEINILEGFSKKGKSYTNTNGSFGWRNPIRQDTGRILQSLVIAKNPKRILEIGTAHGLSALYLYSGIKETNELVFDTIEFDTAVAKDTQERFDILQVSINVHAGEAMEIIDNLSGKYDLVFFDAQKSHYFKQLNLLLENGVIGKDTLILADNVIDREEECKEFLEWFTANKINHSIIPTECGLLVANL
jgi:predicted O-methyltransferase YrrM